jgi:hypothetical protein
MLIVQLSVSLFAGSFVPAHARDFYVSSSRGSDSAAGDVAHPWKTLGRVSNMSILPGDSVFLQAGDVWSEPLVLEAAGSCRSDAMRGFLEDISITLTDATVTGWVVDPQLAGGGMPAVPVRVTIDGQTVLQAMANVSRPDLKRAGVAPNAEHGLHVSLGAQSLAMLEHGAHRVEVLASSTTPGCGQYAWPLPPMKSTSQCVCDGASCSCRRLPPALPVRVLATPQHARRPRIRLDGYGSGLTARGIETLEVSGLEISDASRGITASGTSSMGNLTISDCAFLGVWNRSSIGQTLAKPATERVCSNGWSQSISLASFGHALVTHSLFDDVDVALQPLGALDTMRFVGNTVTRANGNTVMMVGHTEWLISGNVFSRDDAPRFFMCGTTDIMIGQLGTRGSIAGNEIGWRGEHPASADGCAIDYEGGSDGVAVTDNLIHDSYGAGVMAFGLSDKSRNISNASISRNVFVRNGAQQLSDDHGEVSFMERGSTGVCEDNVFFADDTDSSFIFHEPRFARGAVALGWKLANNTVHPISSLPSSMAETPAISQIVYTPAGANVTLSSRFNPPRPTTVLYTIDGSWPRAGQPGTTAAALGRWGTPVMVPRTAALNARFIVAGLLPSLTTTLIVPVPEPGQQAALRQRDVGAAPLISRDAPFATSNTLSNPAASSSDAQITWAVRGGAAAGMALPGTSVAFDVTWGVSNSSTLAATTAVMRGGFWYGSDITTSDPRCVTGPGYDLVCVLGPIAVGGWAQSVRFSVAVPPSAPAGMFLPFFLGGATGFEEGPESFGRVQVSSPLGPSRLLR